MRYSTGMKLRCPSCLVESPSVKRILYFYSRLILEGLLWMRNSNSNSKNTNNDNDLCKKEKSVFSSLGFV